MKNFIVLFVMLFASFCINAQYVKYETLEKRVLWEVGNKNANLDDVLVGTYPLMTIPAKTAILSVSAYVETAAVGGTLEVGDGSDVDGFLKSTFEDAIGFYPVKTVTAANTKAGVYQVATEGVELIGGKYYATADTLDLTISSSSVSAGKVWFIVKFMKL